MHTAKTSALLVAVALLPVAAFADRNYRGEAISMLKRDFQPKGIATVDRLNEDAVQAVCNRSGNNPPKEIGQRLEKDQLDAINYPADGKLLGNWKEGEKIAQSGRGFTWTDKPGLPVGGNCYNCHQIAPQETSFGTLGPSLYQFGKTRGNGPDMQKYVYGKIFNAKAYNLCSQMPRFGHAGALNEQQIRDLVALLLDPESSVNK